MKKIIVLCLLGTVIVTGVFAQLTAAHSITVTVPKIQIVRLLDSSTITLAVTGGTAGDAPVGSSNATKYLQYTVINPVGVTQRITVALTAGTLPAGTALAVAAAGGSIGTGGSTPITGTAANLITAIPSGFTGTGAAAGMNLTYTLTVPTPGSLVENGAGASVTVTYTILDT
jgi:hypothetical protein